MQIGADERILFVGAHADDVELFAGGTMARFASQSSVICFSRHRGIYESPEEEFTASLTSLGILPVASILSDLEACGDRENSFSAHRQFIFDLLRCTDGVSLVVTHQSTDTNQDHIALRDEVLRVFKGRVPVIGGSFYANDYPLAARTLLVSLAVEHVERKIEALRCYKSQQKEHRGYFDPDRIWAEARYWGGFVQDAEFAEAFESERLWI